MDIEPEHKNVQSYGLFVSDISMLLVQYAMRRGLEPNLLHGV